MIIFSIHTVCEEWALPLYEYKCVKCGHRFEKIESMSASEIKKCPKCGAKAERQLSRSAIQFKGSGWYVTDYAGKKGDGGSSEKPAGDTATAKPAEKSGETSKASDTSSSSTSSSETKKPSGKSAGKSKK
jgi:putative FmdB family regulatory protein